MSDVRSEGAEHEEKGSHWMCTIGTSLHMVRIDLLKLHLMPGRKSTFMLQSRDVARDFELSTSSKADGQYGPGLHRLPIGFLGKVIDLKPFTTHGYRGVFMIAGADDQGILVSDVERRLIPPRTAKAQMVSSPSKSLVS
jgi:hypothetical protein